MKLDPLSACNFDPFWFDQLKARAERDPAFRVGLLEEALNAFLDDDIETGKILLRHYVNATLGFEVLAIEMDKNPKSLMRMLSIEGNPRADNLFSMLARLKGHEGVTFAVKAAAVTDNPAACCCGWGCEMCRRVIERIAHMQAFLLLLSVSE